MRTDARPDEEQPLSPRLAQPTTVEASGEPTADTPQTGHRSVTLTVDGEVFIVRPRQGDARTYDYDWVSGPNEGYGFSSTAHVAFSSVLDRADTPSGFSPPTVDEHRAAIRDFLAGVDPDTGYLGD